MSARARPGGTHRHARRRLWWLAVCAFLAARLHADEATDRFVWEQANAALASAHTPAEFLAAAREYNRLVGQGVRNGPLFLNLGTALLMAGDGANAVAALERAERYDGGTPEIRTNLRLALAARSGRPDAELPWNRVAFFWHYDHPLRLRALAGLGGWCVLWTGILLRRALRPRMPEATGTAASGEWTTRARSLAGACLLVGGAVSIVFGISAGLSLLQERQQDRLWPTRVFKASPQERAP